MVTPILTPSSRAVGAPPVVEEETYEVIDQNETAFQLMRKVESKIAETQKSSLPDEEKEAVIDELKKQHENILARGTQPLEESYISPADALAGPAAFTKPVGWTFGKLTKGVITGSQRLSGKSAVKAFTASLAAEVPVGQAMDSIDESLPVDAPWYVRAAVPLTVGLVGGSIMESKIENGISAIAHNVRKNTEVDVDASTVKDAVKGAQELIDEEVTLASVVNELPKAKKKRKLAGVDKPKKEKKTGKEIAAEIKKGLTPLFEDEVPTEVNAKQYAGLNEVKEEAIGIFPDSYIEAEFIDEFFEPGPLSRKLIAKLKAKGFKGIHQKLDPENPVEGISEDFTRKFYAETAPVTEVDEVSETSAKVVNKAYQHAGANTVTGMTGGVFAGIETDNEGNISGYNINRAIAVGTALAVGATGYSKLIAGRKALAEMPAQLKEEKAFQLEMAEKLQKINQPMDKIGLATGWYKPEIDGGWRTYFPDKDLGITPGQRITKEPQLLSEVIQHPEMEKYYGKSVMQRTRIVHDPKIKGSGSYDPVDNIIRVKDPEAGVKLSSEFKKTLVHELQHAVQHYEGHAFGTAPAQMDEVVQLGAEYAAKPRGDRTLEEQQFLDDWVEAIKALDTPNAKATLDAIKGMQTALKSGDANAVDAAINQVKAAFSTPAYMKAYGEVEARAVEDVYDKGAVSIKDLLKPGYVDSEKLIVSMWNSVANQPTAKALDGMTYLASRLDDNGIDQGIFKRWENYANNKLIEPFKFWVDSRIASDRMRKAFGIYLPRRFRELKADYDRQANRSLDQIMTIASQLQKLAPTSGEQRRLLSVLRGTETARPEEVQVAQQVRRLFDELREASLEAGLRDYDMYDALTKTELEQLKNVVKFSDDKKAVEAAQEQIKNHYRAGGSYEYIPVFLKKKEGVVGKERKALKKKLNKLKALARRATELDDDEPLPHLRDEIAEIEEVLAINANNAFNTERKWLSRGYANVQAPEEATKLLNKVDQSIANASYTTARALTEQTIDLQRLSFLNAIKDNAHWVLDKATDSELVPSHFRQLKGKKYGPLNGMYVDRVIAEDIDDMGEVTNAFIRNWDKLLGFWKQGKAVFNPATHVGNFTSNVMLAHLGGVSPADLKTYGQAAQAIQTRMKNKYFREAESWGLMNNTFSAAELSQFRKSLSSFREVPDKITSGQKVKDTLANWMSKPATLYEKNEQFFKMAVFIRARKDGASIDEAAKKAEEYLFNYRDIPPIVREYKRWASPFFTFTYKATGLLAKEVIRHPHKLALWGATLGGMTAGAMQLTGTSWDEMNRDHQNMPGGGVFNILLPWKDTEGNRQYWDISRLVPIGQYEQKWGQTGLPLGSFAPTANPLTAVVYEIALNKDLFTGQEIVNKDLDSLMAKAGYWAAHVYREMTPSLAPGNYSYNNLVKGLKSLDRDVVDYTGQEVTMQDMITRSIFGFKVTSATRQAMFRSFKSEVMRIDRGIGKRVNQAKTQYQRGEITREEYDEVRNKLIEQKRFLKERIYDRMED